MPSYWSYSDNFGEWITHLLLGQYGVALRYADPSGARLVGAGSILEKLPDTYSGVIWGTGFIADSPHQDFPRAKVLAVRGKLTAAKIGRYDVALGDPGLLASWLMSGRTRCKRWEFGIVPHYLDLHLAYRSGAIHKLRQQLPGRVKVIDVRRDPLCVIRDISRCENVLSSSLHGLVVADSLGIPNAWVRYDDLVGGDFKFRDYYSSFNEEPRPLENPNSNMSASDILSRVSTRDTRALGSVKDGLRASLKSMVENHI